MSGAFYITHRPKWQWNTTDRGSNGMMGAVQRDADCVYHSKYAYQT